MKTKVNRCLISKCSVLFFTIFILITCFLYTNSGDDCRFFLKLDIMKLRGSKEWKLRYISKHELYIGQISSTQLKGVSNSLANSVFIFAISFAVKLVTELPGLYGKVEEYVSSRSFRGNLIVVFPELRAKWLIPQYIFGSGK